MNYLFKPLFKKKYVVNLSNFFKVGHFYHDILQDYLTFPALQFIQTVSRYKL